MDEKTLVEPIGALWGRVNSEENSTNSPGWTISDRIRDTKPFLSDKFIVSLTLEEFISMLLWLHRIEYRNECLIIPEESTITKYHAKLKMCKRHPDYPTKVPIYYAICRWNYLRHRKRFDYKRLKVVRSRPNIETGDNMLDSDIYFISKEWQHIWLQGIFEDILKIDSYAMDDLCNMWKCEFINTPKWDHNSSYRR